MKFDLLKLEEPVRSEVLAVAAWRHFDRGVVLFHEGEAGGSLRGAGRALVRPDLRLLANRRDSGRPFLREDLT